MKETDPLISKKEDTSTRPFPTYGYWVVVAIQTISAVMFLIGQTGALINWEWAIRNGLQEPIEFVGQSYTQVGKGFAFADTIFYLPIILSSIYGLSIKKKWALICTSASAGIHGYWSITILASLWFEQHGNVPDWNYTVPTGTSIFVIFYIIYGIALLTFLYAYWDNLLIHLH